MILCGRPGTRVHYLSQDEAIASLVPCLTCFHVLPVTRSETRSGAGCARLRWGAQVSQEGMFFELALPVGTWTQMQNSSVHFSRCCEAGNISTLGFAGTGHPATHNAPPQLPTHMAQPPRSNALYCNKCQRTRHIFMLESAGILPDLPPFTFPTIILLSYSSRPYSQHSTTIQTALPPALPKHQPSYPLEVWPCYLLALHSPKPLACVEMCHVA